VSLNFEPSYSTGSDLNKDMYFPCLNQESGLPVSLSPDLTPHTSSRKGITDDVLVSADPATTLDDFYEFHVGEQFDAVSELGIGITPEVEPRDLDESQ